MRCNPRASNGPNHLGLCALQIRSGGHCAVSEEMVSKHAGRDHDSADPTYTGEKRGPTCVS